MSGTARSHSKLRRSEAGTRLLDRRSRGAARDRRTWSLLRSLDRPDVVERVNAGHVVRLAADRLYAFIDALPDPEPTDPEPVAVRTFVVDGVAHVVAAAPGGRIADASACVGCGAEARSLGRCQRCDPEGSRYDERYQPLPAHPWVLRLVGRPDFGYPVVNLAREATSTAASAAG